MSKRALRKQDNAKANESVFNTPKFWYSMVAMGMMFAGGFVQFVIQITDFMGAATSAHLTWFDLTSGDNAKLALLSGEPYVMYCVDDTTERMPVPELIIDIKKELQKSKH